jgi:hypothetical protein
MPHHRKQPQPAPYIAPSGLKPWHAFAFLIIAAIVWRAAKGFLIGLGALIIIFGVVPWMLFASRWRSNTS